MTGQELRALRRGLGLTQERLGVELGVPQNTIARWETGARRIAHPRWLRLAIEGLAARQRGTDCVSRTTPPRLASTQEVLG